MPGLPSCGFWFDVMIGFGWPLAFAMCCLEVTSMVLTLMPATREYEDRDGRSPFARGSTAWTPPPPPRPAYRWRTRGRPQAEREVGRKGRPRSQIDFGPGYRAYFAFDGTELILLLGGGEKHGQDEDIAAAQERWADYKQRKRAAAR